MDDHPSGSRNGPVDRIPLTGRLTVINHQIAPLTRLSHDCCVTGVIGEVTRGVGGPPVSVRPGSGTWFWRLDAEVL